MNALTPQETRRHLFRLVRSLSALYANLNSSRPAEREVRPAPSDIRNALVRLEAEPTYGCHHPDRKKDALVQQVIRYLARPGIVKSVHNACVHVAGGKDSVDFNWLYTWCHNHEGAVLEFANSLQTFYTGRHPLQTEF